MDTYFIKLKNGNGSVFEIKRHAKTKSDIENLIKEEFPVSEIISIKMLLFD